MPALRVCMHVCVRVVCCCAQAGLITGGDAGNLTNKAARWDEKHLGQLRQQAQDLHARLQVP